ncbi:MAG TPA: glutathione synthase, partial [Usitatibacter sp.]
MKLAFVLDPLEALKAYKDSSVAMMREAARRGHEVHALESRSMCLRDGRVMAAVRKLKMTDDDGAWYRAETTCDAPLAGFDRVLMRKDPPFDLEYYNATLLLDRVEAEGARVVNRPRALRDWNEKLAILGFPTLTPATLVASDMRRIHDFIDEHADVIVKRLDG